ncbi:phosphoheptose isomerase [Deferribacterales bacterium]|nr:phosphoheptose isomerase [Deferribacterales bacterium]
MQDNLALVSKLAETNTGDDFAIQVEQAATTIASIMLDGNKLYLCGVGASCCLAHYAESLFLIKCRFARPPLPALALDAGNIERQAQTLITANDALMCIMNEALPDNVSTALRAAAEAGAKVICLAGADNATLRGLCDTIIAVDSKDPLLISNIQITTLNIICAKVDDILFPV